MLSDAASIALAGDSDGRGKMLLADLCNRPAARAPDRPLDSFASGALQHRSAGGGTFDAVPPASDRLPTLARGAGEERRTGAAPRRAGVIGRARRSKSDPLTLRLPVWPYQPSGQGPFASRPRQGACCARSEAPSIDRCPSRRRAGAGDTVSCAAWLSRRARHRTRGLAATGPASNPLFRGVEAHHLGVGQCGSCLSTSAIITVLQHDCGETHHPAPLESRLFRGLCGQRRAFGARPAELSQSRGRRAPASSELRFAGPSAVRSPAPPARSLALELCPDPVGPGTSCRGHRA